MTVLASGSERSVESKEQLVGVSDDSNETQKKFIEIILWIIGTDNRDSDYFFLVFLYDNIT